MGSQLNGTILDLKKRGDDVLLTCRVVVGRPPPQFDGRKWIDSLTSRVDSTTVMSPENRVMWAFRSPNDQILNSIFTWSALNSRLTDSLLSGSSIVSKFLLPRR
ncbi:hypothetical protein PVAND_017863 [Polypedilum vanderplanki]|uniref:Uncharacterized protein n=1 Tax=Polypedilum vanderplanki TaxID=319348 RepID=A0A9J6B8M5_POLVA|nr:hypothetical protein PVAND_017863 [Polypedilum vanderplanki]